MPSTSLQGFQLEVDAVPSAPASMQEGEALPSASLLEDQLEGDALPSASLQQPTFQHKGVQAKVNSTV